jgi:nitrate/nitrite transporter NarK
MLPRFGARNLIVFGSVVMAAGLFWLSTISANSSYFGHLLPCLLIMAFGIGSIFVPLTTVAVSGVEPHEAGLASALLNVGQQVGGSIGLSVLTTVFATASRSEGKHQAKNLLGQIQAGKQPQTVLQHFQELSAQATGNAKPSLGALTDGTASHAFHVVLAQGSARGFLTAAIFAVVAIVVTVTMIKTGRAEAPAPGEAPVAVA